MPSTETGFFGEWSATVERWQSGRRYRGVIVRPWPEASGRLGQQRVVCAHQRHGSYELAHRCARRMAVERGATAAGKDRD